MTSLAISFRSLKHPLTLASIGLLLLNDHVLKTAMPSALTGKLSDFAGLFFFPFLLAAFLSLPLDRLRLPSRRTAALAFGLTLLGFTLIKTLPWANALTVAALTRLLGWPVQIARDPTDLLALTVLWPAWRLWIHLERTPSQKPPGKVAYLALGLASLATMATPPCAPQARVVRLGVLEQSVYASLDYKHSGGGPSEIARSDNGGRRWTVPDPADVPAEVARQLEQPAPLPVTVCDPENPQTCYRITGAEQVEGSLDGGQTWQMVWQVPWGRRKYMERFIARQPNPQVCKHGLDLGPYDLALLPQNGAATLVVALGNEGVVVRTLQGTWQRYAVMNASPTPYAGGERSVLFWLLLAENLISLVAAVLAWWAFCISGWQATLSKAHFPPGRSARWAIAPAVWAAALSLLSFLLAYGLFSWRLTRVLLPLLPIVAFGMILVFVGPVLTWRRIVSLSPQPQMARQAAWTCVVAAAGIFPLAWLPFPLWVLGAIPVYEIAQALSVLVGISALVWGIRRVRRTSHTAATPAEAGLT
jgi:hypothetical protein